MCPMQRERQREREREQKKRDIERERGTESRSLRKDNKMSRQLNLHFQHFIVVAFLTKKNSVSGRSSSLPTRPPPQKSKNYFYCRLAVSERERGAYIYIYIHIYIEREREQKIEKESLSCSSVSSACHAKMPPGTPPSLCWVTASKIAIGPTSYKGPEHRSLKTAGNGQRKQADSQPNSRNTAVGMLRVSFRLKSTNSNCKQKKLPNTTVS